MLLHVNPEVEPGSLLMKEVLQGIEYMINGQLGLLMATFKGETVITEPEFSQNYSSTWDLMSRWAPSVVMQNLCMQPVYADIRWNDETQRIVHGGPIGTRPQPLS